MQKLTTEVGGVAGGVVVAKSQIVLVRSLKDQSNYIRTIILNSFTDRVAVQNSFKLAVPKENEFLV